MLTPRQQLAVVTFPRMAPTLSPPPWITYPHLHTTSTACPLPCAPPRRQPHLPSPHHPPSVMGRVGVAVTRTETPEFQGIFFSALLSDEENVIGLQIT